MDISEPEGQGARDAATVLPFVAAVLLLPPVVLIFAAPVLFSGIPLIVVYIFGVWAAIILATYLTARRLAVTRAARTGAAPPVEENRG